MIQIPQHQIDEANHSDIIQFLETYDIKTKKVGEQYLWPEQNVWIRGCEWFTHYEQTGGQAVSFVMKFFGRSFREAVKELTGDTSNDVDPERPKLILPERYNNTFRVYMYLRNRRGIVPEVIDYFLKQGLIYEDKQYHCCVFIGRNEDGYVGHCHKRSINTNCKQTLEGSKIEYAFHYNGWSDTIYAFEAPIDMLAYISMHPDNWKKHSYVALCSVSEKALIYQLKANPRLRRIILCLDNDSAGQTATNHIKQSLIKEGYLNVTIEVPINKDWSEDLSSKETDFKKMSIPNI